MKRDGDGGKHGLSESVCLAVAGVVVGREGSGWGVDVDGWRWKRGGKEREGMRNE